MEIPKVLQNPTPNPTPSITSTTCSTPQNYSTGDSYWRTAAELQYRSRCFVEALNGRAFPQFIQYVGPEHIATDFSAYMDNQAAACDWPEFVSILRDAAEADPEYRADIINQSVDLNEKDGTAVVYMFIEVTGRPVSVRRENALVFEWKRQGAVWTCYSHTAMRGASGINIADHG